MRSVAEMPAADELHLVIESRVDQLARVRAALRPWLPLSTMGPAAGADALVLINELVALAIECAERNSPVEVRVRHTHSILVAEVDVHLSPEIAATLAARFAAEDHDLDGMRMIHLLSDRAHADAGPSRVTLAGTIRFDEPRRA